VISGLLRGSFLPVAIALAIAKSKPISTQHSRFAAPDIENDHPQSSNVSIGYFSKVSPKLEARIGQSLKLSQISRFLKSLCVSPKILK
jgi:hypothetical protein